MLARGGAEGCFERGPGVSGESSELVVVGLVVAVGGRTTTPRPKRVVVDARCESGRSRQWDNAFYCCCLRLVFSDRTPCKACHESRPFEARDTDDIGSRAERRYGRCASGLRKIPGRHRRLGEEEYATPSRAAMIPTTEKRTRHQETRNLDALHPTSHEKTRRPPFPRFAQRTARRRSPSLRSARSRPAFFFQPCLALTLVPLVAPLNEPHTRRTDMARASTPPTLRPLMRSPAALRFRRVGLLIAQPAAPAATRPPR